jgi:hypothetical protein
MRLRDVTLCAIDTRHESLSVRALNLCMKDMQFGDVVFFTGTPVAGPFRNVVIDRFASMDDFSWFLLTGLAPHLRTTHMLMIQWDGYVVHPELWEDAFLEYDYIGARWPFHTKNTVGNGGFSLRSRRLLEALTDPALDLPRGRPEDDVVCRQRRSILERAHGIRFAPELIADRFSHECAPAKKPTFGFHGVFNLDLYVSDREMLEIAKILPDSYLRSSIPFVKLLVKYQCQKRFDILLELYTRWSAACRVPSSWPGTNQPTRSHLGGQATPQTGYQHRLTTTQSECLRTCEALLWQRAGKGT